MGESMNMSVSQVFSKEGKQFAFVSFADGNRTAEGKIPDCVITSHNGFSEEEITQLENYMRRELTNLKKMAASVDVMSAFFDN